MTASVNTAVDVNAAGLLPEEAQADAYIAEHGSDVNSRAVGTSPASACLRGEGLSEPLRPGLTYTSQRSGWSRRTAMRASNRTAAGARSGASAAHR